MEENVALDSSKQKQFVKSIKGIKKLIKKNDAKGVSEKISAAKTKDGKVQKKKRRPRGLVYLGHIPHGFYEHEMTQYFKQFGMVTNARVIRSKRTGNSKGFAFVEFKEPAVAEIVAETMNNYLMGKRLIKAAYIPPEKQKRYAKRKFWSTAFNPGSEGRLKTKKAYNAKKDEQGDLQKARKLLSNITKTKKKLSALGINYDFFSPVDVPESLVNLVSLSGVKQKSSSKASNTATDKTKPNKDKKVKQEAKSVEIETKLPVSSNKEKKKVVTEKPAETQSKNKVVTEKPAETQSKKKAVDKTEKPAEAQSKKQTVDKKSAIKNKDNKKPVEANKKQQAQKEKKLKDAGVKPVENFIAIQEESEDSSCDFDSDEYQKMLNDDDNSDISQDNDSSDASSEEGDDSDEESDGENPPRLVRAPPPKAVQPPKVGKTKGKQMKTAVAQKTVKKEELKPQMKRKAVEKITAAPKMSKFENRSTQKLAKKQFKKKK